MSATMLLAELREGNSALAVRLLPLGAGKHAK